MKSKQSRGGRSRVKGKTKLKITHEKNKGDKIYTIKKSQKKGINPKKKKKKKDIKKKVFNQKKKKKKNDRRKIYYLLLRK
jgi:hypothetical protein